MDTTTTSTTFGGGDEQLRTHYVSCIKVDGVPILPPLMTEERRREMRSFKELAIQKEKELRERRRANKLNPANVAKPGNREGVSPHLSPVESRPNDKIMRQGRSSSTSPVTQVPSTSTPRAAAKVYSSKVGVNAGANHGVRRSETFSYPTKVSTAQNQNTSDIPEGVLRERKIDAIPLDLNKTGSSDPSGGGSSSAVSYDGDEEKEVVSMESENNGSEGSDDNFASAASSAGTFIVRRSGESKSDGTPVPHNDSPTIQVHVGTSEDEPDNENAPATVVRKSKPVEAAPSFKRKRPAKYFDVDDEESAPPKSVTDYSSIPSYVSKAEQLNTDSKRSALVPGTPLSFSSVPHTNFPMIAKALTTEFSQKFCANLASSSLTSTNTNVVTAANKSKKSSDGNYNVTLTKDVPSSAEENAKSDYESISNSSDKENRDRTGDSGGSKHVRKLSYTLATPSALLLEATSREKNFAQTLETVPSEASSVGIPSNKPTPDKSENAVANPAIIPIPFSLQGTVGADFKKCSATAKPNLDQAKQAHLERYLGDQEDQANSVESLLRKMQNDHEARLQQLSEEHRLRELKLRHEFENEFEKLKERLSSTFNTTDSGRSPVSVLDSLSPPSATISSRPLTGTSVQFSGADDITTISNNQKVITSGMSGISISERTRSGTSVHQFTGGSTGINSNWNETRGGAPMDLTAVGLSKLQSRIQMMSPAFFRTPVDAKSPLLKGLLFLDPLDKPQPPVRIPPKALEASMKVKFDKISAAVKGYLTRRLLNTEKVQVIIQTIRDTVDLVLRLYEEAPMSGSAASVRPQDTELHQRLIQQLTGACRSFHDVFFKLLTKERMAIIATDREKQKAKAMRAATSPTKPSISNATLKSIERRLSHSHSRGSPPKRDNRNSRVSKIHEEGSQSVKAKPIKSFNMVSPKRRRISYWDDGRGRNLTRSGAFASQQDLNGNNFKPPGSARSQVSSSSSAKSIRSTRNQPSVGTGIGDTFIVSSARGNHNQVSAPYRRESTSKSAPGSSRNAQVAAVSVMSSSVGRTKGSSSRQQPWK